MSHIPWCSSEEWKRLSTLVCSIVDEPDNASTLELTISALNCMMSRLPSPPIGVLMTAELLQAFLATARDPVSDVSRQSRPQMAFAVVRFVNYVSHAYHDPASYGLQPVHKVAVQQNVPDWLVTLRHDAVHGVMPAGHMLKNAMLAALQWTITAYWQPVPESAGRAGVTELDTVLLQRLEVTLAGPRGRHLNKSVLVSCLSSETLRQPALQLVADAMVASFVQLRRGAGAGHLTPFLHSWMSAVASVCRGDLLTELLESLLTSCPTSADRHHQQAAADWVEQLVMAARREAAADQQLTDAVCLAGPICWSQLLETALRHKNSATGRLLPRLMDGLSPPLPERRRQLLLQLVSIATGTAEPPGPSRPPVTVGPEQLLRLGIRLPADDGPTPASPAGATVAPPTDADGDSPAWRQCADGPEWRVATEVGRLPWQHKTPLLLDAGHPSAGDLA